MQRFQYRFESLLNHRAARLNSEKAALSLLYGERAAIQQSIVVLERSSERASRDILRRSVASGSELTALAAHQAYVAGRVAQAKSRILECERRINRQREQAVIAERAWKLLDRLREVDFEEWTYEASRQEEAAAGDLYLATHFRRR